MQGHNKAPLPPPSDDYNAFIAWLVNKVCFVFAIISYFIAAVLLHPHQHWELFRAKDALLSISELSSCQLPGVLPGLATPCPSAPLAASEL